MCSAISMRFVFSSILLWKFTSKLLRISRASICVAHVPRAWPPPPKIHISFFSEIISPIRVESAQFAPPQLGQRDASTTCTDRVACAHNDIIFVMCPPLGGASFVQYHVNFFWKAAIIFLGRRAAPPALYLLMAIEKRARTAHPPTSLATPYVESHPLLADAAVSPPLSRPENLTMGMRRGGNALFKLFLQLSAPSVSLLCKRFFERA